MPTIRRSDAPSTPGATGTAIRPSDEGWWFSAPALRCLDAVPPPRITVIAAPAGSGKARLVRHWLAAPGAPDWVWIDVGPADRATGGIDQADLIDPAGLIDSVIDLDRRPDAGPPAGAVLVLAGLELLTAEQQTRLVERLPAGQRVILISAGLGLPAGCRVALSGDLAELGPGELWWPPGVIGARAHRLTGGWPVPTIIRGAGREVDPATDPDVLDFITEQVLDRLDRPLRDFVLTSSVLDQLDPARCAALAPGVAVEALLAEARRQGLLDLSLDRTGLDRTVLDLTDHARVEPDHPELDHPELDHPDQPRYRPVIRAAARRALAREQPGVTPGLLRRIAEHARDQGDHRSAMIAFAAAGEPEPAWTMLAAAAPSGFRGWSPAELHEGLSRLPEGIWVGSAERRAVVAFAAAISGDHLLAAELIHQTPAGRTDGAPWWRGVTGLLLALGLRSPGPAEGAHRIAVEALAELTARPGPAGPPAFLGVAGPSGLIATAQLIAARAALFDGDPGRVRRHLDAGWAADGASIPRYAVLAGLGTDALISAWGGSLAAAGRRAERAGQLAEQAGLADHPFHGLTRLAEVEVLRARGRSTEALTRLDAAAAGVRRAEQFVAAAAGGRLLSTYLRVLRAGLLLDRADPAAAEAEFEHLAAEGDDDLPVVLAAALAVARARRHLSQDDVVAADRVLARAPLTGLVAATRVTAALHRQAPAEARAVMANWPGQDSPDNRLRLLLSSAAVDLATDRRPEAGRGVDEALAVAEPEGHVQVFLDAPPAVRVLTAVVLRRSMTGSPWRRELAERLDEMRLVTDSAAVPVTRRELAVLEQLISPLTHAQIAAEMFVSENTLKSHCRNLYRKLGVNSRADAIRAARARGWLESEAGSPPGGVVLDVNITPEPAVVEL